MNAQFTIANSTTICSSIQRQFEIRVNPGPRLLQPSSSFSDTICNGAQFFQLDFSQLVDPPTASVSWSCNNGNIDGPLGIGTDTIQSAIIPSFQGQNLPPNNADVNANFTIFLSDVSTSCTTSTNFFRVKVRPKPILDTISSPIQNPLSICNGFTDTINLRTNLFGQAAEVFSRIENGNWGSSFINENLLIINPDLNGGSSIQSGIITVTPTVNGCLGVPLPIAVTTNPNPSPPTIISEYDTICSNAEHQFFSSLSTISNAAYRWNMVPASAGTFFPDENFNNVLIDFNDISNQQTVVINLKTTDRNTTCTSSASKSIVLLDTDASSITGVIVEAALNDIIENLFFFKPESLQIDLLQWGFDDLLNMTSSEIPNANSQILTTQNVGSLNGGLNTMVKEKFTNGNNQIDRFLFWVRIESFGCNNKIYYLTNGKSEPDYPTGIKIIKSDNNVDLKFEVFPNPNNGQFSIKSLSSTNETLLFSIYNATGSLIIQKNENMLGLSQKIFDLTNQNSGLYYLRITDKSGNSNVFKIIKN